MKIELTTEEVKKAIRLYIDEKFYNTARRKIEQIEVFADGASLVVTETDPIKRDPTPAPAPAAAPRPGY